MKKTTLILILTIAIVGLFGCSPKVAESASETAADNTPAEIVFQNVSLEQAISESKEQGKKVFIDVSTSWCGYCKKMKKGAYLDDEVATVAHAKYVSISVDAEKGAGVDIAKKYGVTAYPTFVILNAEGELITKHVGYLNSSKFLDFINN